MKHIYCQNGRIGPRVGSFPPNIFLLSEGSRLEPVDKPDYDFVVKLKEWSLELAIKVVHGVTGDICEDFRFCTGYGSTFSFNQVFEIASQSIAAKTLKSKQVNGIPMVEPEKWINWFIKTFSIDITSIPEPLRRLSSDKQYQNRNSDNHSRAKSREAIIRVCYELRQKFPHMTKTALAQHQRVHEVALKANGDRYSEASIYKMIDVDSKPGRPPKTRVR